MRDLSIGVWRDAYWEKGGTEWIWVREQGDATEACVLFSDEDK